MKKLTFILLLLTSTSYLGAAALQEDDITITIDALTKALAAKKLPDPSGSLTHELSLLVSQASHRQKLIMSKKGNQYDSSHLAINQRKIRVLNKALTLVDQDESSLKDQLASLPQPKF